MANKAVINDKNLYFYLNPKNRFMKPFKPFVLCVTVFFVFGCVYDTSRPSKEDKIIEGNSTVDNPDKVGDEKKHLFTDIDDFAAGESNMNEQEIAIEETGVIVLMKWETLTTDRGSVIKSSSIQLLKNPNEFDVEMSLLDNQSNMGELENFVTESRAFVMYFQETTLKQKGGTVVIKINSDNTFFVEE